MSYTLDFPIQYIANPDRFATIGLGALYIGVVDGDPAFEPADRIQAYIARQNDTDLAIPQPITLSAGGVPVYLGSPVTLKINQSFSCAVLDKNGVQVYYSPKAGEIIDELNNISAEIDSLRDDILLQIDNVSLLITTEPAVGKIYFLKEYYLGIGKGGGHLVAKAGAITPDNGITFASGTAGVYFERMWIDFVTPEMFGCQPSSNAIDTTRAINKAYVYANSIGGGIVKYESSTYALNGTIDGTSDISATNTRGGIQIKSNTLTIFTGQIFTQEASTSANYSLINCSRQSNFVIMGRATFIGDALIHAGVGGEFGHGLYLADSHNFHVSGLTIKTCWGDGCYISATDESTPELGISTASSDGTISECVFDSNRRQGFSGINGKDIVFDRCHYINTGRLIATNPGAGIDMEPDASPNSLGLKRFRFNNCVMDNNVGPNVLIFPNIVDGCVDIEFNFCSMLRTAAQGSFWSDRVSTNVKNIIVNGGIIEGGVYGANATTFNDVKISRSMTDVSAATYAIEHTNGTFGAKYNNCEIRAIGDTTSSSKKIYFSGTSAIEVGKTQFSKCKIIGENIYGTVSNVLMVVNAPNTFTDCEFLTEGTAPIAYVGFDSTPGASRLTPSYAMLYNCYVDPTWHIGFPGIQNRVNFSTVKVRSLTFVATNLVPLSAADVFEFLYTANGANSIANPTDPYPKIFHIRIKNTSGVATTAPTFGTAYRLQAAWVQPAAGQNRTISFYHDGTYAYEISRTTADVPNT